MLDDNEALFARMRAEADQHRAAIMDASIGDAVTAPRGGEPCILAGFIQDSRIVSHDGGIPKVHADWCRHEKPNAMYFEYVGGRSDGMHGWYDAHDACRRVFQWG